MRVLKRFDGFLADKAFCGIEFIQDVYEVLNRGTADTYKLGINLEAALIGAEKGSPVIREFMKYYESHDFILPDGNLNYALMPRVMNEVAEGMGYAYKWNEHQLLDNGLHIYPYDYFTTQAGKTEGRDCSVTHRTAAIHLCTGSWIPVDKDRKPHSRYTEWRLLTVKYFKDLWKYVVRHKYDK